MNRSHLVLAYLFTLLAVLMGVHLSLLMGRDTDCRKYERVLLERLGAVPPGSPQATTLRNEIQNYFDGRYSDCSSTEEAFSETADKYLSVLLALLTGAGVAGAAALRPVSKPDSNPGQSA